jgi:hypothetical protein
VRYRGEPGALFLWGWLSQPFGLRLPSGLLGLPYAFANLNYDHCPEHGLLHGAIVDENDPALRFVYRAVLASENAGGTTAPPVEVGKPGVSAASHFSLCAEGSLAEFAMERGTGFFCRRPGRCLEPCVFRAWHPPWRQTPIDAVIQEDSLVRAKFPWFEEATLAAANFAPGFERVQLGRAYRLAKPSARGGEHSVLSGFYDMP